MMKRIRNILQLSWKELISLRRDTFMVIFVIYSFSFAVYSQATGISQDLSHASIAVVDEDHSILAHRIISAIQPPLFQHPVAIARDEIDPAMDRARFTFVVDIPPNFESDVRGNRSPTIQVLIDATAMMQAGLGANYLNRIIQQEVAQFVEGTSVKPVSHVAVQIRAAYNQGLIGSWFTGTMGMLNNITMLSVLLSGAALLREREHGTLEHLLVMPVGPTEIMVSKILANALIILSVTAICVYGMLRGVIGLHSAGSVGLFLLGTAIYLFFTTSLGIFLGTIAHTMPQLGLMFILLVLPMNLLSGSNTPVESMPPWMQNAIQISPSTHFVSLAQAILFRGAGLSVVWSEFAIIFGIGLFFFVVSFLRFRSFLGAQ
jgi:ABC-2 type transport system permease protein